LTEPWVVERLVPGGDGFCRAPDGRAAFVAGGLPGDRIRPLETDEQKRMVRVRRFELIEAGPDRRDDAPCEYVGRCGGCDWMFLKRDAQLRWKRELVADALRRIAKTEVEVAATVSVGPDLGYRSRLRLHVDAAGRVGLYERGSHRVVEIDRCVVADEGVNVELRKLRAEPPTGPCDVELRGPSTDGVPASAFVQINPAVNLALVEALVAGAVQRGAGSFLDLYCGAGNFALSLVAAGLSGTGVERNEDSVDAARRVAQDRGLNARIEFIAGSVPAVLRRLTKTPGGPALVVLDPPRVGARKAIAPVLELRPTWIAAVSCDPPTLARDVRGLLDGGYQIESVTPFDMFPQTHHVEVLVWLAAG
jgi:tRNA/tmRNA/rRNA uracil-C5-methylase (TrmA/RlmC/RlmD family)